MTTLLAFAFVLGVLVFVHELGHFMAARWNGVRVLTFSLGFGPKLLKFRRGDTEYCLSAVPLGGYVKMAGENPEDPRSGQPDEFLSKSKWQRFQILIMGPAMNLILAVDRPGRRADAGRVGAGLHEPAGRSSASCRPARRPSALASAPGDIITRLGSADVATWEQLEMAVASRPEREVEMVVIRDGREERLTIQPDTTELRTRTDARFEVGTIGVLPDVNPSIRALVAGGAGRRRPASSPAT